MKVITDIRKSTPVLAVVGVTDLATNAVRTAQADLTARAAKAQGNAVSRVETLRAELTPAKLRADAQNMPNLAITKALEAAGRAEETYGELATRGKSLVSSVRRRSATKELLSQSRSTLTLGKAAVTTVRKASDETLEAAKATLTAGRRTVTTAKAGEAATKKATKAVRTSAAKTTSKAATATKTAASATGRKPAVRKTTARKTAPVKTAARKTAVRKTTARKTAARKTTARKTTARKTTAS
jgi:heparin binding hemagglutinin HbhA